MNENAWFALQIVVDHLFAQLKVSFGVNVNTVVGRWCGRNRAEPAE